MFSQTVSRIIVGIGVFGVLAFSLACFAKDAIQDLGKTNGLADLVLIQDWRNGDLAILIRHEERCDRSSNLCFGPADGVTVVGSERAKKIGAKLREQIGLDDVDRLTSPMVRTVQTAQFMFGGARQLPSRHTICGKDVVRRLSEHKDSDRSLILMTHSTCINDLIKSAGYRGEGEPDYGSLLFVKFLPQGEIEIVGNLNLD